MANLLEDVGILRNQFLATGEVAYLENAIGLAQEIIEGSPGIAISDGILGSCAVNEVMELAQTLGDIFDTTGEIDYLNNAIGLLDLIDAKVCPGEGMQSLESMLSAMLEARYGQTGVLHDLERAIKQSKEEVAATPTGHPDSAERFEKLSNRLHTRFEELGTLDDLNEAIGATEKAVAATQPDHADRASMFEHSSEMFGSRFQCLGDLDDLGKAIRAAEQAVEETPPDHPDRTGRLGNLGSYFSIRFDRLGGLDDLEIAIHTSEAVVAATPIDHPDRAGRLTNLSNVLHSRFQRFGAVGDLDKSIQASEEGIAAINHPDPAGSLNTLSMMLNCRFGRLGDLDDLENAIWASEEAVEATPAGHPDRSARLDMLSNNLHTRFEQLGDLEDLAKAIQRSEEALEATPVNHPDRPNILNNLGYYLSSRFGRLGELDDLENAINLSEEAVAATPSDHPDRAMRLSNLGQWLGRRFGRFGVLSDLEKAIRASEQAVAATATDNPQRAGMLGNLSNSFHSRFQRLGAVDDLEIAIHWGEESVAETPFDHPDRAAMLGNLSVKLHSRFERSGALEDLEKAIQVNEEAVAVIAREHPTRPVMLASLSILFCSRFERLGAMGDLAKAVWACEEAVTAPSADHPHWASILKDYSRCYRTVYDRSRDLDDLEKALQASEQAVAATPITDPDRSDSMFQLASLLHARLARTQSSADLQRSLEIGLDAWRCEISPPLARLRAAYFAANKLVDAGRWMETSVLLADAVKMLPQVSPQFLERGDHEHILSEFSRLATGAISAALQVGSPAYECLSLLELGRGIIMGFTIDRRSGSDLSELQVNNSDVLNKLICLRAEVDSPLVGMPAESYQDRRRRRVQAIHEIEETLVHIRQLPGFERFQLPPSSEELISVGAEGPIIIFNSTKLRSDAIIVTSVIKSMELPNMVFSEVQDRMKQLGRVVRGKRSTYPSRNQEMQEVLLWLWAVAVGPVFEELGFGAIGDTGHPYPRVWWIGVGSLAIAPFHAAGDHSHGSTLNTMSRAISSYVPTIKALSYARQKKLHLRGVDSRLLLVAMPTTPDTPAVRGIPANPGAPGVPGTPPIPATPTTPAIPRTHGTPAVYRTHAIPAIAAKKWKALKNATKEVREIMAVVKEGSGPITTRLDSPSTSRVLEELLTHHAIHFACHGVSDGQNPSNSHLLLRSNSGPEKLTVGVISNMNIKNAQVAYLSACCTADNASAALADESIHIASGFQLAGFSHVLASLWETNDNACRQVAGEFYRLLYRQGGDEEHRAVSAAFHDAVGQLRKDILGQPIKWASFIHTGA